MQYGNACRYQKRLMQKSPRTALDLLVIMRTLSISVACFPYSDSLFDQIVRAVFYYYCYY